MILPFHNWKDKLKNFISKYPKTMIGFGVLVLAMIIFVGWTQAASANPLTDGLESIGKALLGGLISIITMILYYVLVVPLFWLIAVVIQVMVEVASWQLFINEPAVIAGWTIARDLVNVGFIAVLLYIAFGTVISYQKVNWQKDLIKLITAVVLVNFSRMIVGILIDVSQVIMLTFVNGFRNIAGGNITGNLGLDWYLSSASSFTSDPDKAAGSFIRLSIGVVMGVLLLSILAMLTAWLLLRIVKLWILTVMAPFYFLADFFPFLKRFHSYWEKEFTDQLVAGPFMAFGIWFAMSVISQTGQSSAITTPRGVLADASALTTTVTDGSVAKQSNAIFTMIIGAGLLYGVYDMSKSMAGAAAKVGQTVFKKSQDYIKAGVVGAAKGVDWGVSQISQRKLGRDISVGGAQRYIAGMKQDWRDKVKAVEAGSVSKAETIQLTVKEKRLRANKQYAEADKIREELINRKERLENEKEKTLVGKSLIDRLQSLKNAAPIASQRSAILGQAINDAKTGNFSTLNNIVNDDSYGFSADMKARVAAFTNVKGRLNDGSSAISAFNSFASSNRTSKLDSQSDVMKNLIASGVLSNDDVSKMVGKSYDDLLSSGFVGSTLNSKFSAFSDMKTEFDNPSGNLDTVISNAKAAGISVDNIDIFKDLNDVQKKENNTLAMSTQADALLTQWGSNSLNQTDATSFASVLGLSTDEAKVLTAGSQQSLLDKIRINQDSLKQTKEGLESVGKEMEVIQRKQTQDYYRSNSTRVRSQRLKEARDVLRKANEKRYPLHETPEDLADLFLNTKDKDIRDFVLNKLKPEDAHEFLKRTGSSPDITGVYETILKIGSGDKAVPSDIEDILDELRKNGKFTGQSSNPDPVQAQEEIKAQAKAKEQKLMDALNAVVSDSFNKETVQSMFEKFRKEIPTVKYALDTDKLTGKLSFNNIEDRELVELDQLKKRGIIPEKYDGFVYEDEKGEHRLSKVGFQYFFENAGRVQKKMQDYQPEYVQALVQQADTIKKTAKEYRDEMIKNASVEMSKTIDSDYNNLLGHLQELQKLTASQLSVSGKDPRKMAISTWEKNSP